MPGVGGVRERGGTSLLLKSLACPLGDSLRVAVRRALRSDNRAERTLGSILVALRCRVPDVVTRHSAEVRWAAHLVGGSKWRPPRAQAVNSEEAKRSDGRAGPGPLDHDESVGSGDLECDHPLPLAHANQPPSPPHSRLSCEQRSSSFLMYTFDVLSNRLIFKFHDSESSSGEPGSAFTLLT